MSTPTQDVAAAALERANHALRCICGGDFWCRRVCPRHGEIDEVLMYGNYRDRAGGLWRGYEDTSIQPGVVRPIGHWKELYSGRRLSPDEMRDLIASDRAADAREAGEAS